MLVINPEVREALATGAPVVALESTIITHGMPFPTNLETALGVEAIVREGGAVPATIAILEGAIHVGLSADAIAELARAKNVVKTSRRDLAVVVAKRLTGATTVAGTMMIAAMAGIRIFVTGGLGGVHRGAAESMDVSADLIEFSRSPVGVVCAGSKAILDIGLTLEYLETHGVPVLGFKTDRFPAFYTPDSGFPVAHRVESAAEVAQILDASRALGTGGGIVIANPIAAADALVAEEIEASIVAALDEAARAHVTGKDVTPYLLAKLHEVTAGRSLTANIALIRNNARVGAAIAVELSRLVTGR